jgi:hypothetical protein
VVPILQTNPVLVYNYSFANVITNYSSPTTLIRTELIGFETEPWSTPDSPVYRTNIIDEFIDLPSGAIIIVPPNVARFDFVPGQTYTNIVATTNTIISTNVVDNGFLRPLVATEITFVTNVIYGVFPYALQDAPASVLRGGLGKITFQRLTNAIVTGTNFFHTNNYSVAFMTNRFGVITTVTNEFRIVNQQPDILFRAADLGVVTPIGQPVLGDRSINLVSNAALNSTDPTGVGGPGNIFGPTVISYSNTGPALFNTLPGTATEATARNFGEGFLWGSFDGSTNPPIVFPRDITLEDVSLLVNGGVIP